MRAILGAVAAAMTLTLAAGAQAADMPRKGPALLPFVYNWSGFYVGLNAGYGWADGSGTMTVAGASGPVSGSGTGFLGGVQAGYNWQRGAWVYGIEADAQASAVSSALNGTAGATTMTADAKIPWFGTLRGRVGYAFDRTLLYFTGGGVYGRAELEGTMSTTGAFSSSKSFWTYTIGGGLEQALMGRWTAKIEYLYMGTPNAVPLPPGVTSINGSINTSLVRGGLNYRF